MATGPVWAQPPGLLNTPVYYLSLGTSLAAGVQADPESCQSVVTEVSYPGFIAEYISENQGIRKLRHVNLGCPGETAETFIYGGLCDYPKGSQLYQAVQFLHAHGKFTGLITIDLGANDVLQCVDGLNFDEECIENVLEQLSLDLFYVLETLREVAPGVPIVGMNYYNPLLAFWFLDPRNPVIAELTKELQTQINGVLESVYAANDVPVADVAGAFMADADFSIDDNVNGIPDSVDLVYLWTWMCVNNCGNIHPNVSGYEVIADAFNPVLPDIQISEPPRRR
jgi:lysophospholipase L1-like esterase